MTNTTETPVSPYAAVALARTASRTRLRLNHKGYAVMPPREHAQRLVGLLAKISDEPYCESPEHSERILTEFDRRIVALTRCVKAVPLPKRGPHGREGIVMTDATIVKTADGRELPVHAVGDAVRLSDTYDWAHGKWAGKTVRIAVVQG